MPKRNILGDIADYENFTNLANASAPRKASSFIGSNAVPISCLWLLAIKCTHERQTEYRRQHPMHAPQMSIKASSERLLGLECKLRNAVSQVACVDAPLYILQRFTTFLSVTLSLGVGTTILSEYQGAFEAPARGLAGLPCRASKHRRK